METSDDEDSDDYLLQESTLDLNDNDIVAEENEVSTGYENSVNLKSIQKFKSNEKH